MTGSVVLFDPFELQCLAYLTTSDIAEFMRPSFQEQRQEAELDRQSDDAEGINGPEPE